MATIVNNPATMPEQNNGSGFMMGAVLLALFLFVMFYFGLPMIRNTMPATSQPTQINNPAPQNPAPQPQTQPNSEGMKIPDKIDVNINQPDK